MKKYLTLPVIIALAISMSQFVHAQGKGAKAQTSNEANKLAREGADALKNNDWDTAVDNLRKATNLDHKYAPDLAIAYERRGYALAKNQQYQEAIQDYTDALKIKSNEPRIYEERAYAEMKVYDYDKAVADYSELIKLKPNDVRYLNYRAFIYETKDDIQNSMADAEKVLKIDPNNAEAKSRKQRLEQKLADRMPLTPPPASPGGSPKASPAGKKKP